MQSRLLRADVLAVLVLLSLSALYVWLTWIRVYPFTDPGWYMQVTARTVAGDVLYRDIVWDYGPLPVYVLGLLYRLLGVNVILLPLLQQALAVLACLLTYRAARSLLSAPLALLSTGAVFVGSWLTGGGYVSYIQAYTGALPLGAVLGLVLVVSLISYLQGRRARWLVVAGLATGGACLTKLEFALACAGTGLLLLSWIVIFPASLGACRHQVTRRRQAVRELVIYVVSAAIPIGIGYGVSIYQAGWSHVWAGLSGYDFAPIILQTTPPWGRLHSWVYIFSGLGLHLLGGLVLAAILAPTRVRKNCRPVVLLAILGVFMVLVPWYVLAVLKPEIWSAISTTSRLMLVATAVHIAWAPVALWALALFVVLGTRLARANQQRQALDWAEMSVVVLLAYSILVSARFYFYPTNGITFQQTDMLFPVLIFTATGLLPRVLDRYGNIDVPSSLLMMIVAGLLLIYGTVGLGLDVVQLARQNVELVTPRGVVRIGTGDQARAETLSHIMTQTEPADFIVVLSFDPGFYFLSGRRNPLRQDMIIAGIGSSPADAREMVERMETHRPRLVIVPRRVQETETLIAHEPHAGREGYQNLQPVWQYVQEHYQVSARIGGETGYVIYEPRGSAVNLK
ncbi:MAG: glycosyltransferase family 39 protein [Chloroflexi bacterium]|nr:glycosyltransferase family 39 protein [Chloroflexota bacterium]MBU1751368.1 glycosyltransferase family 39 protein [Chloroflexota bacterium]